eukprot:11841350-Karenia_brevis.AAC.1
MSLCPTLLVHKGIRRLADLVLVGWLGCMMHKLMWVSGDARFVTAMRQLLQCCQGRKDSSCNQIGQPPHSGYSRDGSSLSDTQFTGRKSSLGKLPVICLAPEFLSWLRQSVSHVFGLHGYGWRAKVGTTT